MLRRGGVRWIPFAPFSRLENGLALSRSSPLSKVRRVRLDGSCCSDERSDGGGGGGEGACNLPLTLVAMTT